MLRARTSNVNFRAARGIMVAMLTVASTVSRWHIEPCSLVQSVFVFSVNTLTGAQNSVLHCGKPLVQGWANFSERGPDETFGSSLRAEITNKNLKVTII